MAGSRTIFTVGTSKRSLEEFFSVLEYYDISEIVDVRRFPKSSRYPHFSKANIHSEARRLNFSYYWLGDLLGGFRSGGYESYKKEASYLKGLEEIEQLAEESLIVLVCAERLPWKCHWFQISQSMKIRGWNVIDIIDKDHTWKERGP